MGWGDGPGVSRHYLAQPSGRFSRTLQAGEGHPQHRPVSGQRLPPRWRRARCPASPMGYLAERKKGLPPRTCCMRGGQVSGPTRVCRPQARRRCPLRLGRAGARGDLCGPQTDAHTRKDAPHTRPLKRTALPRGGEKVPLVEGWRQRHKPLLCAAETRERGLGAGSVFSALQTLSRAAGSGSSVGARTQKWTNSPAGEAAGEDALCWP